MDKKQIIEAIKALAKNGLESPHRKPARNLKNCMKTEVQAMSDHDSKLASKCQGVARGLTYNDEHQAAAKHTLLAASHALDQHAIRVHRKKDGMLIVNARGKSRYMTLRERLAMWLLRGVLEIRP